VGLPKEHLDWIRATVADHQRRLAQLREGVRLAEEEIAFQEAVLELARNDQLIETLGALHEDPSALTSTFAHDPDGYCRENNIPLPEGATLSAISAVEREGPVRLAAQVRRGPWAVEIVWDREAGFSASPSTGPVESLTPRFMSSIEVPSTEVQDTYEAR
jgi:hypothetical protein